MIVGYVKGQDFTLRQPTIASGTIDYLSATFVFSNSDWDECDEIWVHFAQGDKVYDAEIIDGKVSKDEHINLSEGEWEVYLHGNVNVNGEVVERITTEVRKLSVTKTGIIDGNPFPSVESSTAEKILAKAQYAVEVAEGVREDFDEIPTGGGLTPEQEAEIQANSEARHTHDNYWSLSDLYCEASEAEQGGNNPFPIVPDYVGVDRPTFKGNYLSYCSDGAVIGKVEEKDDGEKFLRLWLYNGPLNTNFNVPDFIDIPVKAINEKIEESPLIGNNGAGLEVDLGVGSGGGGGSGDLSQFIEEVSGSVNLYPPTTEGWTNSAIINSSGAIAANTKNNQYVTPPISVEPNTTYTITDILGWGATPSLADVNKGRTFTSDGTPLSKMTFTQNADGSYTFTTPESASYILLCGYKIVLTPMSETSPIETIIELFNAQFMLVKGTTIPSVFEPYDKRGYRFKDIDIPLKSVKLESVNDEALPIFAPLAGKKIANFGDSIFGNARPPEDVSTYLAEKTGAEVLNCAFGGCRMAIHNQLGHWNAFTMVQLAQAISSGDYSVQDEALNYDDRTSYAEQPLSVIKATDFSTVDILTIAYGTNDFTSNIPLDNSENPYDTATLAGALRTSLESLLTAYPNLKIFVLSTMYRFYIDENNEFTEDSNTKANSIGLKLADYNAKLKEVAKEYNLPYVDDYNIGIGKFNRYQFFNANDGAHHKEEGRRFIAEHLATALTMGSSACVSGIDKVVISVTSAKLNANKVYDFGISTELTITFDNADPTKYNEYIFTFTSGETPTVLTLPDTVVWVNELTIEANKRYEISIVDNIGLWCAVEVSV